MRNEKAMNAEGMQNGRARADELFRLEKYKKEKLGHMLEKKCTEAHPSKKSIDIPTFQVILPQRNC